MKLRNLLFAIIAVLSVISCKNDIEINAPWKETPVVYAFLDPNLSVQYFRIEKTYQNSINISTAQGAQLNDSLYFDNILVKIKSIGFPDTVFQKTTEVTKQPGFFSNSLHYLYKGNFKPVAGRSYTLEIYSPKTGNTYTASTTSIGISTLERASFSFEKVESILRFWMTPNAGATTTSASLRFNYLEYNTSIADADTFAIDYFITENPAIVLNNIRYNLNNRAYMNYLKSIIPAKLGYTRQIIGFDFAYIGSGKELSDLIEISKPSAAIVQKKLEYSNISGGLGIFSSRSENLDFGIQTTLDPNTNTNWTKAKPDMILLLNEDPKNLNFIN